MSQQAQAVVQAQQKIAEPSSVKGSVLQRAAVIPSITPVQHGILQRCSGGVECEECRQRRLGMLQRSAVSAAPVNESANGVPPIVHEVLSSPGQPLGTGTRAFMEPRFGYDFSQVRVHTDARAAESARAVNALGYTVGRDVVFGEGEYEPGTSEGRRLLAHELTHVVQQKSAIGSLAASSIEVVGNDDSSEREADRVVSLISIGHSTNVILRTPPPLLQRQETDFRLTEPTLRLPPRRLHLLSPDEELRLGQLPSTLGTGARYITEIHVDMDTPQDVSLTWSDGTQTNGIECSTGQGRCCPRPCDPPRNRVGGSNCTPDGNFVVIGKNPRTGHRLNFFVHFVEGRPIGLHQYDPVDGTPLSHGCVRLHRLDAMTVFNGSIVGRTRVRVTGLAIPNCPRRDVPACPGAARTSTTPGGPMVESELASNLEPGAISELDPPIG